MDPIRNLLIALGREFKRRSLIGIKDISRGQMENLFTVADYCENIASNSLACDLLKGKVVTLLFYEPSTRTRCSFEVAVKQLGGQTIVVENPQQFSSMYKGEKFEDSILTYAAYCDAIVIRHPEVGAAAQARAILENNGVEVPVINAGDGTGEHPTQALLDLLTIRKFIGRLDEINILMVGDIKNGRTVHSLIQSLALYNNNEVMLLSPHELRLSPDSPIRQLHYRGTISINEATELEGVDKLSVDVIYWTRIQKERFSDPETYERLKHAFVMNSQILRQFPNASLIMHPLPRVGEIADEVDADSRSQYLKYQIRAGVYTRMALLLLTLSS